MDRYHLRQDLPRRLDQAEGSAGGVYTLGTDAGHEAAAAFRQAAGKPLAAMDWGPWPEKDEDTADYKIANAAIEALSTAPATSPFSSPAVSACRTCPCYAPQKWFELYPDGRCQCRR